MSKIESFYRSIQVLLISIQGSFENSIYKVSKFRPLQKISGAIFYGVIYSILYRNSTTIELRISIYKVGARPIQKMSKIVKFFKDVENRKFLTFSPQEQSFLFSTSIKNLHYDFFKRSLQKFFSYSLSTRRITKYLPIFLLLVLLKKNLNFYRGTYNGSIGLFYR